MPMNRWRGAVFTLAHEVKHIIDNKFDRPAAYRHTNDVPQPCPEPSWICDYFAGVSPVVPIDYLPASMDRGDSNRPLP